MKLKPDGVGRKAHAREPRPLDCVFVLLDVLLGCAPAVVESQHPLVRQASVGDDEADPREQFAGVELKPDGYPFIARYSREGGSNLAGGELITAMKAAGVWVKKKKVPYSLRHASKD